MLLSHSNEMRVEHRHDPLTRKLATAGKSTDSLIDLCEVLFGCNDRYLEHLSARTISPPAFERSTS